MGKENQKLFVQARRYLVGGVNSPVRAFNYVGGSPLLIKRGRGAKVYDYDAKEYIDYVLSWGSLILGHAPVEVVRSVVNAAGSGFSFGTTNKKEVELAKLIQQAIPLAQKIRFVNSGTEAVMSAVRLARGYTSRVKIVKFAHSYHGHADYLLAGAGSGMRTLNIPQSRGIPKDFLKHTIIIPYADSRRLDEVFRLYGREIAAVLVEPVGANHGVVLPDKDFLRSLRAITKKYGTLLIADEVITGFRFAFGSFMQQLGIKPDLTCLGKIIGGGLPIGAYAGKECIMKNLAPRGKVYQGSTFAGNPVVMQAGIATLLRLKSARDKYVKLSALTRYLSETLEREARGKGISLQIPYYGSMFSFRFKGQAEFRKFYRGMLGQGVYFAPSEFEANFLSFAHRKSDIDKTIVSARDVFSNF